MSQSNMSRNLLILISLLSISSAAWSESEGIEEVIVTGSYILNDRIDTATGLGLSLRETPQSVSVITAQRVLDQNLDTIANVIANAPGVSVNEIDDVRNTFFARGFEINNYQVDGVPLAYTLAGGAGETVLDVSIYERVEIVRGATGLLTGVGDPSASVNLVRKHAGSTERIGYLNASFGRWNNMQITVDASSALNQSGTVRGRVVAKYEEGESNVNLFEDKKTVLYGVIEADLSENTLLSIGASHQKETPTAPAWGALPSWYTDGSFADWPRSQTSSANWSFWDTTNQNIFASLTHTFANDWELNFNYNWLKNAQKTEILYLFGLVDQDTGLGLGAFPYSDDGNNKQNSFDIQLKGDYSLLDRDHEFVIGALDSKQTYTNDTFSALNFPVVGNYFELQDGSFPYPGFSDTASRDVDMETTQSGVYGSTRFNFSDVFKVILGGRVSSWNRKGINFGPEFDFGDSGVFIPYAGILYDVAENHTLYASYTEIFKPQDAQDRNRSYLDPIVGESAEIGLKSAFFGDALQTSLAIFQITQDNLAQPDLLAEPDPNDPLFQPSIATKGSTSDGFEIEVVGRLMDNWNISFAYTYFDLEDADGNEINTDNPRKLLNLFTTYSFTDTLDGLVLGAGVNWQSDMYSDTINPVTGAPFRFEQDSYSLVNLMARYEFSEQLSVQANIDNLTDEKYFSQVGFFDQYRYGKPRNYSLSMSYTF